MNQPKFEIHPAADVFPLMSEDAFADLKRDIQEHGVRESIVLFQGKLIDGRNRYRAMLELGIPVNEHAADMEECEDPIGYVLSHNLYRRHLTASQRAQCAAEVAKLRHGSNQHSTKAEVQNCTSTLNQAAEAFSVSRRSVASAKHVADNGAQEVVDAVKSGEIPVSVAAEFVDAVPDKAEQKKAVKEGAKAVRKKAKEKSRKKKKVDGKVRPKTTAPEASSVCPRGGEHEWTVDDGERFCSRCKEPGERLPTQAEINAAVIAEFSKPKIPATMPTRATGSFRDTMQATLDAFRSINASREQDDESSHAQDMQPFLRIWDAACPDLRARISRYVTCHTTVADLFEDA